MKKLLVCFLSLLILFGLTVPAYAKVVTTYGDWTLEKYRNDSEWRVDSCSLTDAEIDVIRSYAQIPVTGIGEYAFMNNTDTREIRMSYGMLAIGGYAFTGMTSLEKVALTESISVICEGAFSGTTALKSINLEDTSVSEVEPYVLMNSGITNITFPITCNKIWNNAFLNCKSLTAAYIPHNVGFIGTDAFKGCDNLVIYAAGDSYAIEYAIANGIDYVITDAPVEVTYMVGDADGDGAVSILDATKIQRVLVDLDADPDGMIALRADSDGKGLDILDATRIQRYLADFVVDCLIGEYTTASVPVI